MNKLRRKQLAHIAERISELDALRDELAYLICTVLEEEQEALDNMPDSLQDSERGQQMQEYIDSMEEAKDLLEEAYLWQAGELLLAVVEYR